MTRAIDIGTARKPRYRYFWFQIDRPLPLNIWGIQLEVNIRTNQADAGETSAILFTFGCFRTLSVYFRVRNPKPTLRFGYQDMDRSKFWHIIKGV